MTASLSAKSNGTQGALLVNGAEAFSFDGSGVDSPLSVSGLAAGNALAVGLTKCGLRFRSASPTSGIPAYVKTDSDLALSVPSGATLGTISSVAARLILLAINNAGSMELAIVNLAGGNNLDETGVINTTAISAGSASANVIYSQTARTGVAYRVVGSVDSLQTVAGTYAAQPTLVQPAMGNALDAMQSLGYGQTWQNVSGSRATSTTYYNTTGKPIVVIVTGGLTSDLVPTVNGVSLAATAANSTQNRNSVTFIVPPNASYSVLVTTIAGWTELR